MVVTYEQALGASTSAQVVVGGRNVAGAPRLDPADARRLIVPITAAAPGVHRVAWEVVGSDGHTLAGGIAFRVSGGPEVVALRRVGVRLIGAATALRRAARV